MDKQLTEKWTQKYKKSIDCSNPKGFSQKAHCQGRKKLQEDLRRWFKEKWTSQSGEECGSYTGKGRVKCRPSKRVSEKSPQTWGEMDKEEKEKAVRLKQSAHKKGKQWSSHKSGKTWDGPKNKYRPKSVKEETMKQYLINKIIQEKVNSKSDCGCGCVNEEKKPFKGFVKGKNHPEGGLSRAEAKRKGIRAGIDTKREAQRKGGFDKLSSKTQARRKSFCARMCGMKRRNTSAKTANDPDSKINAALRVWGCRCGTNESFQSHNNVIIEANKPTNPKLWSKAKALARKKFDVYPSAYANGWAAKWYKGKGGGWRKGSVKEQLYLNIKRFVVENAINNLMSEEVVNQSNAGTMTPSEISSRDRIAKGLKNVKSVKRGDSLRDAKYRLATFIQLKKRGKEGKSKKKGKKK